MCLMLEKPNRWMEMPVAMRMMARRTNEDKYIKTKNPAKEVALINAISQQWCRADVINYKRATLRLLSCLMVVV